MTLPSPIDPTAIPPRAAIRLQLEEVASTSRRRVRSTACVIPGCKMSASRSSEFSLCLNHLLLVWARVEVDPAVSEHHRDATRNRPELSKRPLSDDEERAHQMAKQQRLREIATKPGTLYVLDAQKGMVKIGWTGRDLWERLDEYPPHFRLIVSVPGTRADERDVHRSLRLSKVHGQEWYEESPEVVRQINAWIALANVITQQKANANRERFADTSPDVNFSPTLLPAFTSLRSWQNNMVLITDDRRTRPAPRSKLSARRIG